MFVLPSNIKTVPQAPPLQIPRRWLPAPAAELVQPTKLIARDEAAIGERSEATDFSVNFKSREFSADFQVPEPDGLVIVAQGEQ